MTHFTIYHHEDAYLTGYTHCLSEVLAYLQEQTQYDKQKRFIDVVPILEKIAATSQKLSEILKNKENAKQQ